MPQEEKAEGELDNYFLQWMEEKSTVLDDTDELERYLSEPRLNKISLAVDWWKEPAQRSCFPLLHLMTFELFFIPALLSRSESFQGPERR